jgi:hypothetical protein
MKLIRKVRSAFSNLYFLLFVNGFLVCLYLNLSISNNYEDHIFNTLSGIIANETRNMPEDSVLSKTLHTCHFLIGTRSEIFHNHTIDGDYATSLSNDLMTAGGACGSYSKVMARLMQKLGYTCRIGQMKVNGLYGGHIVPEIKTEKGWVIVDPMFDLVFTRPDGKWASFKDVSKNWAYYKQQVPANYQAEYQYEDVRYTNWDKIPVIMHMIKSTLDHTIGKEKADQLSFRSSLLPIYHVYCFLLLCIILPLSIYLAVKLAKLNFRSYPVRETEEEFEMAYVLAKRSK